MKAKIKIIVTWDNDEQEEIYTFGEDPNEEVTGIEVWKYNELEIDGVKQLVSHPVYIAIKDR